MNNIQPQAFSLDRESAIEGSGSSGFRITETGPYKGIITRAEWLIASTGAQYVQIDFESSDGSQSNSMDLYIINKEGQKIFGFKKLQAIMTCCEVRGITPSQATIKKYDIKTSKDVTVQGIVYPEIMNRPIGLILQKQEYVKNSGEIGFTMEIFAPFNAKTMQTADEVFQQSPPKRYEAMVSSVKDKKAKQPQQQNNYGYQQDSYQQTQQTNGYDKFDDDIPF